jgi:hypothetical protein
MPILSTIALQALTAAISELLKVALSQAIEAKVPVAK